MNDPVLIISFWNPTPLFPNKGVFIKDQIDAIFKYKENITFLEINILPKKNVFFEREILIKSLDKNTLITINIYSIFWKLIYIAPDFVFIILRDILILHFGKLAPKIIHSNVIFPCGFVGSRFAKYFNAKHLISEHWSKLDRIIAHPIYGSRALNIYRKCNAIICVSDFLVSNIKLKTGNTNVFRIPNIIDTKIFQIQGSKKLNINTLNIICIATWELPKRLDLIIDSISIFANKTGKNIILNVIGEGSQRGDYKNKSYPSNLKVNFLGFLSKFEIASLLQEAKFFMHASNHETFSIVTAEALSTGTPVLVSNVDALPELLTISNGYLVENKLESWVEGLGKISETNFDFDLISKLVLNKYSPKAIFLMIEEVYESLLKK